MRRIAWNHGDCVGAPGGCSEEEASGELSGLKATAPEHRGAAWRRSAVSHLVSSGCTRALDGCPEEASSGSCGLRVTHSDRS